MNIGKPRFFPTPAAFRKWLQANHAKKTELWVGFHKKATGKPSMTWQESVDQALSFGWIDGVRKSIDEDSYVIRFTPRKQNSIWSAVNTKRARELTKQGLMHASGLKKFEERDQEKTNKYSFERDQAELPPALEKQFRANRAAWKFFQEQPAGYRKLAAWYVISAKQDATRQKRLTRLVADSEAGRRIGMLEPKKRKK